MNSNMHISGNGCYKCGLVTISEKGRRSELTGKRFNKLTVLGPTPAPEDATDQFDWWLVQCSCGREPYRARGNHLVHQSKHGCRVCAYREISRERTRELSERMVGNKFGKLTVLRLWGSNSRGVKKALSSCDCGQTSINYNSDLIQGLVKSCGCLPKGSDYYQDFLNDSVLARKETCVYYVEVKNQYHKIGITLDMPKRSNGDYTQIFYERWMPRAQARGVELVALRWTQQRFQDINEEWLKWEGYSELRTKDDPEKARIMLDYLSDQCEEMGWESFWEYYGLMNTYDANESRPKATLP